MRNSKNLGRTLLGGAFVVYLIGGVVFSGLRACAVEARWNKAEPVLKAAGNGGKPSIDAIIKVMGKPESIEHPITYIGDCYFWGDHGVLVSPSSREVIGTCRHARTYR
ncbi:MAG TPA: hypothetical protein VKF41_00465 [Bryobacteraceae bacterium]|nr:hypothetical protein [Bryobacteraceae bacterium]